MKSVFWNKLVISCSILAYATTSYAADDNNEAIAQYVLEQIQAHLEIEVNAIDGAIQSQVFSCTFYGAKPWLKHEDGSKESWSNYLLVQNGDNIEPIAKPVPSEKNPQLIACLNDGFTLTSESDAMLLLNSIEGILGEDSSSSDRRVVKTANGWQLITGKFFDDNKGYTVQTDSAGKVIDLIFSYELPTT